MPINNHKQTPIKKPICISLMLALSGVIQAADFTVTEPLDDGTGLMASTLSWAILQANTIPGEDHISLETDVTITGVMKRLIDSDVTLTSDSTHRTISGNNQFRPLFIKSGQVLLSDLTITEGLAKGGNSFRAAAGAGMGGALFVYNGQVTVSRVTISDSSAIGGESSGTGSCYSSGSGMFGRGMFDLNGNYGGYGSYQTNDPSFGSAGMLGEDGGFGGGGGQGSGPYTDPGNGGFGGGGGTGEIYYGGFQSGNNTISQSSCGGDYYSYVQGTSGFGSGGGYGGAGNGAGMGGGVFIRGGNVRFEQTTIINNNADATNNAKGLGGGVFILQVDRFAPFVGGSNNRGLPINLPRVSGCRLMISGNTAKSKDANSQTTDEIFDVAGLLNIGLDYPIDDTCLSLSGNDQFIENNDGTPNTADFTHFGSVELNSQQAVSHQFILKNHAVSEAILTNNPLVTITGDHPGDFLLTSIPDPTIASDGMTEFEITFQPTQSGYRSAQVEIDFDDGAIGLYMFAVDGQGLVMEPEIELRGDGQTIINDSLTPNSINNTEFSGTAVLDGVSTQSFAIHNTGNDNLLINGTPAVEITGPEASSFQVSSDVISSVIMPDTSSSFEITFDPTVGGLNSAIAVIQNNDPDESPHTFSIAGLGLLPEINITCGFELINGISTPISVENGSTDLIEGCTQAPNATVTYSFRSLGFYIRNEGAADLHLTNNPTVELINLDGDHFSIGSVSTEETVIAPGESEITRIEFQPTTTGPKSALVRIASTDEDEPLYEFTIQGLGISRMIAKIANPETTITEGEAVIFELNLTAPVDTDVVINYESRVHSSAITQEDLVDQPLNGQVIIPANTTRVPLYFEILADGIPEDLEILVVRFSTTNELVVTSPRWISPPMRIVDGNYSQHIFANGFE